MRITNVKKVNTSNKFTNDLIINEEEAYSGAKTSIRHPTYKNNTNSVKKTISYSKAFDRIFDAEVPKKRSLLKRLFVREKVTEENYYNEEDEEDEEDYIQEDSDSSSNYDDDRYYEGEFYDTEDTEYLEEDYDIDAIEYEESETIPSTIASIFWFFRVPIAVALVILIAFNFFIDIMVVPSSSMEPTIPSNAVVLVLKNFYSKERGGIYTFKIEESNKTLVKRAIGIPNDTIEFNTGTVYVNGKLLQESYISNSDLYSGKFNLPHRAYLMIGDNRFNSVDSRFYETPYVMENNITGRVIAVIAPLSNIKIFTGGSLDE